MKSLSTKEAAILQGNINVIPTTFRPDVLATAHEGYPVKDFTTSDQTIENMSKDIKDCCQSCKRGSSADKKYYPPPMIESKTHMGPWRDYSADFKGPHIAGKYYFDVLINNDSQWSEVEVLNNTSFEQ